MDTVGLAIIGSTGVIGRVHIDAIAQLDSCHLVGSQRANSTAAPTSSGSELGVSAYPTL